MAGVQPLRCPEAAQVSLKLGWFADVWLSQHASRADFTAGEGEQQNGWDAQQGAAGLLLALKRIPTQCGCYLSRKSIREEQTAGYLGSLKLVSGNADRGKHPSAHNEQLVHLWRANLYAM